MYTTYTEAILQLFFNHVEQKASFLYKLSLQPYPDCVFAWEVGGGSLIS